MSVSIFASRTTKTIPIPFTPPHEVTIQKLAGRHLQKAQQVFFNALIEGVKARGGASVQKDMEQLFKNDDTKAQIAKVQADPLNGYDKHTLIVYGVKAWTLDPDLSTLTPEAKVILFDDLDEEAVDFFATEILRLTKPALFQTTEEAKAAQREAEAVSSIA